MKIDKIYPEMEKLKDEDLSPDSSDSDSGEDVNITDISETDGINFKKKFKTLIQRVKRSTKLSASLDNADEENIGREQSTESGTTSREDRYSRLHVPRSSCIESSGNLSYDLHRRNRGLAVFIINSRFDYQPYRPFAHMDQRYMTKLFKHMGFEIRCLEDRKSRDLWRDLIEFPLSRTLDPKRKLRQHVIFTRDGNIPTNTILEVFNDDHCPSLIGKPRMFFIQACRCVMGADEDFDIDKGVDIEVTSTKIEGIKYPLIHAKRRNHYTSGYDKLSSNTETIQMCSENNETQNPHKGSSLPDTRGMPEDNNNTSRRELYFQSKEPSSFCYIPCYEDYLVMFSSSSERTAWSDKGKGGWLLYCLYKMFKRLLDSDFKTDLLQILSDVSGKMARELRAETPSDSLRHRTKSAAIIYHMLTKDICLEPKYRYTYEPLKETTL